MVMQTRPPESIENDDLSTEVIDPPIKKPKSLPENEKKEAVTHTRFLEEWANSIISPDNNDGPQPTINLSRFGLKNPQDVIRFLKSPAGEATLAEIGTEIARTKAIQDQQQHDLQQHNLLMHRLRALLFLWLIDKETYAFDRIKDLNREQIAKKLKAGEKSITAKSTSKADIAEIRAHYDRAIDTLTEKQNENAALTQNLVEQLEKLDLQEQQIEHKFSEYESSLEKQEQTATSENFSKEDIELKIKALAEQIDGMTTEVGGLLEEGRDDEARVLLNKQNALNLQVGVLHDMRAVHNSEKYYADAEGKMVHSFKEAHFILAKGNNPQLNQRIVKDDNKLYLLKPGQDWNSVKDNPQEKAKARQDYKVLQQDVMSVKHVVMHHKNYEIKMCKAQADGVTHQLSRAREDGLLISNQIQLVQAARASAENAAKQPLLSNRPIPSPTPTAGKATTPKPSQASATVFYREQLKALKESTKDLSRDDLFTLANLTPGNNRRLATDYLKSEFERYARRGNIPQPMMRAYLKNLERFGVDSTKPNVSNITQPLDEKSTPTPFNAKPTPFKS